MSQESDLSVPKCFSVSGFHKSTINDILNQLSMKCVVSLKRLTQEEIDFHTRRRPVEKPVHSDRLEKATVNFEHNNNECISRNESTDKVIVSNSTASTCTLNPTQSTSASNPHQNPTPVFNVNRNHKNTGIDNGKVQNQKPITNTVSERDLKYDAKMLEKQINDILKIVSIEQSKIQNEPKKKRGRKKKAIDGNGCKPSKRKCTGSRESEQPVSIPENRTIDNSHSVDCNSSIGSIRVLALDKLLEKTNANNGPEIPNINLQRANLFINPDLCRSNVMNEKSSGHSNNISPLPVQQFTQPPLSKPNEQGANVTANHHEVNPTIDATRSEDSLRRANVNQRIVNDLLILFKLHFTETVRGKTKVLSSIYTAAHKVMVEFSQYATKIQQNEPKQDERERTINLLKAQMHNVFQNRFSHDFTKTFNDILETFGINSRWELIVLLYCQILANIFNLDTILSTQDVYNGKLIISTLLAKCGYKNDLLCRVFSLPNDQFRELLTMGFKAIAIDKDQRNLNTVNPSLVDLTSHPELSSNNLVNSETTVANSNSMMVGNNDVIQTSLQHQLKPSNSAANPNNSADLNINIQLRHSVLNNGASQCCINNDNPALCCTASNVRNNYHQTQYMPKSNPSNYGCNSNPLPEYSPHVQNYPQQIVRPHMRNLKPPPEYSQPVPEYPQQISNPKEKNFTNHSVTPRAYESSNNIANNGGQMQPPVVNPANNYQQTVTRAVNWNPPPVGYDMNKNLQYDPNSSYSNQNNYTATSQNVARKTRPGQPKKQATQLTNPVPSTCTPSDNYPQSNYMNLNQPNPLRNNGVPQEQTSTMNYPITRQPNPQVSNNPVIHNQQQLSNKQQNYGINSKPSGFQGIFEKTLEGKQQNYSEKHASNIFSRLGPDISVNSVNNSCCNNNANKVTTSLMNEERNFDLLHVESNVSNVKITNQNQVPVPNPLKVTAPVTGSPTPTVENLSHNIQKQYNDIIVSALKSKFDSISTNQELTKKLSSALSHASNTSTDVNTHNNSYNIHSPEITNQSTNNTSQVSSNTNNNQVFKLKVRDLKTLNENTCELGDHSKSTNENNLRHRGVYVIMSNPTNESSPTNEQNSTVETNSATISSNTSHQTIVSSGEIPSVQPAVVNKNRREHIQQPSNGNSCSEINTNNSANVNNNNNSANINNEINEENSSDVTEVIEKNLQKIFGVSKQYSYSITVEKSSESEKSNTVSVDKECSNNSSSQNSNNSNCTQSNHQKLVTRTQMEVNLQTTMVASSSKMLRDMLTTSPGIPSDKNTTTCPLNSQSPKITQNAASVEARAIVLEAAAIAARGASPTTNANNSAMSVITSALPSNRTSNTLPISSTNSTTRPGHLTPVSSISNTSNDNCGNTSRRDSSPACNNAPSTDDSLSRAYANKEEIKCRIDSCNKPAAVICSGCESVAYCSARCQKVDWYGGHIERCAEMM